MILNVRALALEVAATWIADAVIRLQERRLRARDCGAAHRPEDSAGARSPR